MDAKVREAFEQIHGATRRVQMAKAAAEQARKTVVQEQNLLQAALREALRDGTVVGDRAYQIGSQVYILQRRKVSHDTVQGYNDDLTHDLLILPVEKLSRRQQVS